MRRRILWASLASAGLLFSSLVGIAAFQLRPDRIRNRITHALADRLNADVAIDELEVTYLPRMRLTASGVALRIKNRPDLPPFVSINHLWIDLGLLSATRRHVSTMHVDGLNIQVPPGDALGSLHDTSPGGDSSAVERALNPSHVIVDHLVTHDGQLAFISRKPDHRPLVFAIAELKLDDLGFDRAVPFQARLTNPLPTGLVDTKGTFGPWNVDDPGKTAVIGTYDFSRADLSTLQGLQGTLSSKGKFDGKLTAIHVSGSSETDDFNLQLGGHPVRLTATFDALVDGTDGTTRLQQVDAKLDRTSISASGAVTNLPGPGRHAIDLDVNITQGRLEDILTLLSGKPPLATGDFTAHTVVHLPPGATSVLNRLSLSGRFGLSSARFQKDVQVRVQELSRRTQGLSKDHAPTNVASNVRGRFAMTKGIMKVESLSFDVPGAVVSLSGLCNFNVRSLALHGELQMEATISKAVGGFKSIFLRVIDPFFTKPGRGTVVPIKVVGTIDAPEVGLNLRNKQ
jgi:uncharacterized protein involved in outer membrane biogenesis